MRHFQVIEQTKKGVLLGLNTTELCSKNMVTFSHLISIYEALYYVPGIVLSSGEAKKDKTNPRPQGLHIPIIDMAHK